MRWAARASVLVVLLLAGAAGGEGGGAAPQRPTQPERPCGASVVGTTPADFARFAQSPRERYLAAQRARFEAQRSGTRAWVPGGLVESEARRIAEAERQRAESDEQRGSQPVPNPCGAR